MSSPRPEGLGAWILMGVGEGATPRAALRLVSPLPGSLFVLSAPPALHPNH
jgi:hypothetical protein